MNISNVVNNDIELIKKAKKKIIEASEPIKNKNWTLYSTEGKIQIYTEKIEKNGCFSVCGTTVIHASPKEILNEIRNQHNWKKIDNLLEKSEYFDLAKDRRVIHLMFHGLLGLFSKRDTVFLETVIKNKDESIIVTSIKSGLDIYPISDKYVRTEIISGGWYIQPFEKNKCLVTHHTHANSKIEFMTPQIMNIFASKVPLVINKIKEILEEKKNNCAV
jgi:START domain